MASAAVASASTSSSTSTTTTTTTTQVTLTDSSARKGSSSGHSGATAANSHGGSGIHHTSTISTTTLQDPSKSPRQQSQQYQQRPQHKQYLMEEETNTFTEETSSAVAADHRGNTAASSGSVTARTAGAATPTESHANECGTAPNTIHNAKGGDGPLPRELKRILQEVAKTGACSWLSWDQETNASSAGSLAAAPTAASASSVLEPSAAQTSHYYNSAAASSSSPWEHHVKPSSFQAATYSTTAAAPSRSPCLTARRSTQGPPRKKLRNGLYKGNSSSRMRFGNPDGASNRSSSANSRKRPLFLIRTNANAPNNNNNNNNNNNSNTASGSGAATLATSAAAPGSVYSSAPSSVGSDRTYGSEPDDSTQYECDSEGTSATTNSEVSVERLRKNHQQLAAAHAPGPSLHSRGLSDPLTAANWDAGLPYKTLQSAFRVALGLVLDHFYQTRGGYKLSPAEKRRNDTLAGAGNGGAISKLSKSDGGGDGECKGNNTNNNNNKLTPLSSEDVFLQRRQRLMMMLLPASMHPEDSPRRQQLANKSDDPPFTIQRVAEVLVAPERYYTQTHKLCNCLEKLLLVTSSTGAFGGSTGGDTSQSRREEQELAALASEKGRQETRLRQRRLRKRTSSPADELVMENNTDATLSRNVGNATREEPTIHNSYAKAQSPGKGTVGDDVTMQTEPSASPKENEEGNPETSSREMLEAAARASLRTKFDHVGIDPHSSNERDVRAIAENRGMTNSPPPPSLAMSAAASNIALPGHAGVAGFVRQHLPEQNSDHHSVARVPSPILFSPGSDAAHLTTASNMHMLQLHHAVAMAGVSLNRGNSSPLDLMTIDAGNVSQMHGQNNTAPGASENADLDGEHGRSSASNSDVDSESDDISLDDSASDRSDGSDSGHYEPFTAARAMALNRMQQQQRLQSRVLTSLNSLHQTEGYRPPADSEYQSGDSIDSTRAEDSGGSDSSSSDLAD